MDRLQGRFKMPSLETQGQGEFTRANKVVLLNLLFWTSNPPDSSICPCVTGDNLMQTNISTGRTCLLQGQSNKNVTALKVSNNDDAIQVGYINEWHGAL